MAAAAAVVLASMVGVLGFRGTDLFDRRVIRGKMYRDVVLDRWNDFRASSW